MDQTLFHVNEVEATDHFYMLSYSLKLVDLLLRLPGVGSPWLADKSLIGRVQSKLDAIIGHA